MTNNELIKAANAIMKKLDEAMRNNDTELVNRLQAEYMVIFNQIKH